MPQTVLDKGASRPYGRERRVRSGVVEDDPEADTENETNGGKQSGASTQDTEQQAGGAGQGRPGDDPAGRDGRLRRGAPQGRRPGRGPLEHRAGGPPGRDEDEDTGARLRVARRRGSGLSERRR